MLLHLRCATSRVLCHARCSQRTHYATRLATARFYSSLAPEPPSSDDLVSSDTSDSTSDPFLDDAAEESARPESFNEFLRTIGAKYKSASPKNWLGGEIPFPMNPSFLPPAPVSDTLRTRIYKEFMRDPIKHNVRALSQKYHISLKRIDAILRLKGLENAWMKGRQLQTGFQEGMEKLLGVAEDEKIRAVRHSQEKEDWTKYDVHQADLLEQEEDRDAARQRYQRLYWESVPESGGEPIVPAILEQAKQKRMRLSDKASGQGTDHLMPRIKDTEYMKTPREKVQVIKKTGRPTIELVDIGSKFLNADERLKRMAVAERRARVRQGKGAEKEV
ncbi:hypothetical protein AMATHDRAFT_140294 [Amanita thiersii Skay4041]|uniref:37S ribosomal protein S35, mitochondrial n=1 Tax=Amanita thiersii Skay4041 TaxID=703135 RepID=A0A2A9NWX4_9AGAR|nr:hypothetical protein AMATHDRAFT_140294 [Amanita thiersii Skay4041]